MKINKEEKWMHLINFSPSLTGINYVSAELVNLSSLKPIIHPKIIFIINCYILPWNMSNRRTLDDSYTTFLIQNGFYKIWFSTLWYLNITWPTRLVIYYFPFSLEFSRKFMCFLEFTRNVLHSFTSEKKCCCAKSNQS